MPSYLNCRTGEIFDGRGRLLKIVRAPLEPSARPCFACHRVHDPNDQHIGDIQDFSPEQLNRMPYRPMLDELAQLLDRLDGSGPKTWSASLSRELQLHDAIDREWLTAGDFKQNADRVVYLAPRGAVVRIEAGVTMAIGRERRELLHAPCVIEAEAGCTVCFIGMTGVMGGCDYPRQTRSGRMDTLRSFQRLARMPGDSGDGGAS